MKKKEAEEGIEVTVVLLILNCIKYFPIPKIERRSNIINNKQKNTIKCKPNRIHTRGFIFL